MPRESYCCRSCVYPRTPPIGVALSCETPISNINCCCRGRLAPSSKKNRGMEISLLLSLDAINAPTLSITNMLTFPPSLTLSGLRFLFYTECDILLDFIADNIHPHTKFNTTIEIRFKKTPPQLFLASCPHHEGSPYSRSTCFRGGLGQSNPRTWHPQPGIYRTVNEKQT